MIPNLSSLSMHDGVPIDGKRGADEEPPGQLPPMIRNTNEDVIPYLATYEKLPEVKAGETRYGPQHSHDHSIEWCMWFKPESNGEDTGSLFKRADTQRMRIRTSFDITMNRFWSEPPPKGWGNRLLMYVKDQTVTGVDESHICRVLFCLYLPQVYVKPFMKWIEGYMKNYTDEEVSYFAKYVLGMENARGNGSASLTPYYDEGKPISRGRIDAPGTLSLKEAKAPEMTLGEYANLGHFTLTPIFKQEDGARQIFGQYNDDDPAKLANKYPDNFIVEWSFFLKNTLAGMGDGSFGTRVRQHLFQGALKKWFETYMSNWKMPDIKDRLVINTYEYETLKRTFDSQKRAGTLEPLSPVTRVECQLFLPRCAALAFKYMLDYQVEDEFYTNSELKDWWLHNPKDGTDYAMQLMFGVIGARGLRYGRIKVRIEPVANHSKYYGDVNRNQKYKPSLDVDTYDNQWKDWNWVSKTSHEGPHIRASPPVYLDPSYGPEVIERHLLLGF